MTTDTVYREPLLCCDAEDGDLEGDVEEEEPGFNALLSLLLLSLR